MRIKGLPLKTKIQVFFILVLCIQLLGSQSIYFQSQVSAVEPTSSEPNVTITSPISGDFFNVKNITITGTIKNVSEGMSISIFNGTEEIGITNEVINNTWSIEVELEEGNYTIYSKGSDSAEPSNTINITIDTTMPTMNITEIRANADGTTFLKGTASDNLTNPANIQVKLVHIDNNNLETEILATNPDSNGIWSLTTTFTDKLNKYFLVVADSMKENSNRTMIPIPRPRITSIMMTALNFRHKIVVDGVSKDQDETVDVDIVSGEDINRVVLQPRIKIEFSVMPANISFPIYLFDNKGFVESAIPTKVDNHIELSFKDPLLPGKTYFLLFNPSLLSNQYNEYTGLFKDDAGNLFFPLMKKFTTVGTTVKDTPINELTADFINQPHGYYTNNTNACANCHSTHVGANSSLEKKALSDNYCMSCHDGTVAPPLAAPSPEKIDSVIKSKHETALVDNHETKSGSCTSCHNPHLTWSPENPNLLKDHEVYTNSDNTQITSLNTKCQDCHQEDTVTGPMDYHSNSTTEVLSYKKLNVTGSQAGNYSLCLRCHNLDEKVNIQKYYTDSDSGHSIKANDGSVLNGHLPCAECHDTHGSNNIKMLKDRLGHEDSSSFTAVDTDINSSGVLSISKERQFCLACHNGITSVYGVTGKNYYDSLIVEHTGDPENPDNPDIPVKACSSCHGIGDTEKERALSAAHGPKTGIKTLP